MPKVAIFHDYISNIGGGEKVALALARHLKADLITTDVDRSLISKMGFDDVNVLSLGSLPAVPPLKQLQATWKFRTCDFSGKYDFYVFSGNWAHHASLHHKPNLLYCYTPVRVFYDMRGGFLSSLSVPARLAAIPWLDIHSMMDKRSIARVDRIVSISDTVARRVKKYYGRDSVIVYPFCDTARFGHDGDDGFWLSVNRLYPEKRIEVQAEAFRKMPGERLIIVGRSGKGDHSKAYAKKLKESLPENVSIMDGLSEEELIGYYSKCRGVISTAADEDFGMTAVEGMASGKPVIAPAEGGYLETVIDGETGRLIECYPEALIDAIKEVSADPARYRDSCVKQSKKFDIGVFFKNMDVMIKT